MLRALAHTPENLSPATQDITHYSPLLHCSLLALATAFSDDPLIKQERIRETFAERAKQFLEGELALPSLAMAQGLAILSDYHCGKGDREKGYIYMGETRSRNLVKLLLIVLRNECSCYLYL
jgi:hypothetical protein